MRMIVLSGGALQIKRIRVTKGITPYEFTSQTPEGAAILAKLKERSSRINWSDDIDRIDWTTRRGDLILWFLTNDVAATG